VLVTGIGPFATDTYIAALPQMQRSLQTTAGVAQLTLTAFIVGLAVGQLVIGPVSDGFGRRRLLLASTVTFVVTSVLCALAPSGPVLVAVRLVQGVVAGGGVATGRAVVSDFYPGHVAAARFATLAAVTFLGPVIAPTAGGVLLTFGSWRLVFAVLAGLGLAMAAAVWWGVPETLPPEGRQGSQLSDTQRRVVDLLRDRRFMRHVAVQCLASAGFFTYIGGSSFVLQTAYGVSPSRYAVIFATNATAMVATSLVARLVVGRTGPAPLRRIGLTLPAAASAGLLLLAVADPHARLPLALPWALLCLTVAGMGLSIPATTALAQEAGRRSGGTAAALQGGLAFLVGASVTPLTGVLGYETLLPMAASMALFFVLAVAALAATARSRGRSPR
jgi:MFS transporter, DHA1 family, multidrug resistance protein